MKPFSKNAFAVLASLTAAVLIPLAVTIWPLAIKDQWALLTTFTSLILIYLGILIAIVTQFRTEMSSLHAGLAQIRPIPEGEFYSRFDEAIRGAQRRVKITYLSNKSPIDSKNPSMRAYYKALPSEIRKRAGVEFKRVVRALPQMIGWIDEMVADLGTVPNFSLACLMDTDPKRDSIDAVSVQCVDMDKVFLVAVGEQQESREPRDVYVESQEFNRVWNTYFDRLWEESLVVVDRGRPNKDNLAKVRSLFKS